MFFFRAPFLKKQDYSIRFPKVQSIKISILIILTILSKQTEFFLNEHINKAKPVQKKYHLKKKMEISHRNSKAKSQ